MFRTPSIKNYVALLEKWYNKNVQKTVSDSLSLSKERKETADVEKLTVLQIKSTFIREEQECIYRI